MRIGILGPLEVRIGERPLDIGGPRVRALLVLLALEAGRTVRAERLIDDLWEDDPPAGAVNALHSLVSRLRAALDRHEPDGPRVLQDSPRGTAPGRRGGGAGAGRELVESHPHGYRLALPPASVDAFDFEARVTAARRSADAAQAGAGLREALALWRGSALADFRGVSFAEIPAARFEALRLSATEERIEADLALGRHAELIPELEALAAAHPTRERVHGHLMRALYGAGRQADALLVHAEIQRRLSDALGVDPGPELAEIHLAVLHRDPWLLPATPDSWGGAAADARAGVPATRTDAPDPGGVPRSLGGTGQREADPRRPGRGQGEARGREGEEARGRGDRETGRDTGVGIGVGTEVDRNAPPPGRRDPGGRGPARTPAGAASRERPTTNLRSRLTSFIGRDDDIERVTGMLEDTRLVTLTGTGGGGKTRLAIEAAEPLLDRMPDGVWFVDLSPVTDPAEAPLAVISALGLREMVVLGGTVSHGGAPEAGDPLERVSAILGGRRMLLILDNCEHLIDAAARLADRLLAVCPGVRILATSREPLGITGESVWPVEPLPIPSVHARAEEAPDYPAVRLLADRAQAVRPGFRVTAVNVASVVRICRALDGMPLAIELAAARLRALTTQQVASRLDDRFRLLASGSRTALPRHQTLRAVVEWSWELLDPAERTLWCTLSLFSGGATLQAAEAVCADLPAADVLDVLTALVDKSLVVALTDERIGAEPRYRMLETIRAFGLERLGGEGREDRLRRAHAEYFLSFAEQAEPELRGHDQLIWLDRLAAEHENVHAALRCAVGAGDTMLALRLCAAMGWYWFLRGHRAEATEAINSVLAMPGVPDEPVTALVLGMGVLNMLGETFELDLLKARMRRSQEILERGEGLHTHPLLRFLGPMFELLIGALVDPDLGRMRMGDPDLTLLEPVLTDGDPWLRSMGHFMHAQVSLNNGRAEYVDEHLQMALVGFRQVGDRWGAAFSLTGQAEVLACRGEHERAIAGFEEALRLMAELGAIEDGPYVFTRLANQLWLVGERERADEVLETSLRYAERSGQPAAVAAVQFQLGEFARRRGATAEARDLLERALAMLAERQGPLQFRALIRNALGLLDSAEGRFGSAREHQIVALTAAMASWDAPVIATVIVGFADLALREGHLELAAELLGAAERVRGLPDLSWPEPARIEEAARGAIGEEAFTAARGRGGRMAVDNVLERLGIEYGMLDFAADARALS